MDCHKLVAAVLLSLGLMHGQGMYMVTGGGSGGGGTPGGSTNDIQFNTGSTFGGGRCTMDSSQNIVCTGQLTAGNSSGVAGAFDSVAGTAPAVPANAFGWGAPTTMTTSVRLVSPNALPSASQVMLFGAPSSNVASWTWTGVSGTGSFCMTASCTMTGAPAAPTASQNDNSTKVATTAYADRAAGAVPVTLSGPIASLPVTVPAAGSVYICTDSPYQFVSTGSAWQAYAFGYAVTPPVLSSFTVIEGGTSGFTDTTHGGIIFGAAYGAAGAPALGIAIGLSTPWYVDACFTNYGYGSASTANGGFGIGVTASLTGAPSYAGAAAWLNNGTTGTSASDVSTDIVTDFATGAGFTNRGRGIVNLNQGAMVCNRISDDGTNRKWYVSSNPYFSSVTTTLYSETRTNGFTAADAMITVQNYEQNINAHLLHWSVHN